MSPQQVAIIGTGQTRFKKHHGDKTYAELVQDATLAALANAKMTPDDIDAVVFSMAPTEFAGIHDIEKWSVDSIFGAGKPLMRIHTGGATGGSAIQAGYTHVASGLFRNVLIVGADRVAETPDAQHILNLIWDRFYEYDFALNTVTMTSLASQRQMARYGTTQEQFARVVVRARANAMKNPNAHLKGNITVDDVMNSPFVAWPYKLFDCCPRSSGGAAMVLTNLEGARAHTNPAFINGIGAATSSVFQGDKVGPKADVEYSDLGELEIAGRECYQQAGITDPMKEIQVAELYDPFSTMQFPQIESLGFCGRGEAAAMSDAGAFEIGAELTVSPSGGSLCTNPIGVTGLVRGIEAANQVMNQAGEMQVKGVQNALTTAIGGSAQFYTCSVFGADHL